MKKILYLINYLGNGGTEKYVSDLIQSFGADNCLLAYSEKGPGYDQFRSLNVEMVHVPMNSPYDLKAAKTLKKLVLKHQIELIHAQFLRENNIAILAKLMGAPCKVIWTYHVNVPMGSAIRMLNRLMTKKNDRIIAVSNFMKKQITEKGVSDNKVTVIYNGIKTQIPYKERIPNKTYQLAVVGRMTEEKGHAYLLNSLAQLNDMHPNLEWVCHFYGEGLLQEDLKQQSNSLGLQERIVFHGFESDQEKVYGNTDVVIVPSENDALPYVAIESLAYGIPVIGTNVGGVPEIVSNNETGYIVEYGDTKSMGEKIASIIQNQMIYSQFSINARKRYEQLFSQQKMIDEVKKIYQY